MRNENQPKPNPQNPTKPSTPVYIPLRKDSPGRAIPRVPPPPPTKK
ncbi:hypothetical protein [Flavobacterium cheonanense]